MLKAKVFVTLKPSVLDPQGKVVTNTLHTLGYDSVVDTRISKYVEVLFNSAEMQEVTREVEEICDKVLANPNTETYHFEIEKYDE